MLYKDGREIPAKKKKKKAKPVPALISALLPLALFIAYALLAVKVRAAAFWAAFWLGSASLAAAGYMIIRATLARPRHMRARTAASLTALSLIFAAIQLLAGAVFVSLPDISALVPLISMGALLALFIFITAAVGVISHREAPPKEPPEGSGGVMRAVELEVSELAARCANARSKEMILSVSAALLFSDPLSNFDTASCEDAIARYVYQLDALTDLNDAATVESVCDAIHIQIERRNEICAQSRSKGE